MYLDASLLTVGGLFCDCSSDSGNIFSTIGSLDLLAASFRLRYSRLLFLSTKPAGWGRVCERTVAKPCGKWLASIWKTGIENPTSRVFG